MFDDSTMVWLCCAVLWCWPLFCYVLSLTAQHLSSVPFTFDVGSRERCDGKSSGGSTIYRRQWFSWKWLWNGLKRGNRCKWGPCGDGLPWQGHCNRRDEKVKCNRECQSETLEIGKKRVLGRTMRECVNDCKKNIKRNSNIGGEKITIHISTWGPIYRYHGFLYPGTLIF